MELRTPLTPTKTQVDRIGRLEYSDGILKLYFVCGYEVSGEAISQEFDSGNPVVIELTEAVSDALNVLFLQSFNERTKQLAYIEGNSALVNEPDYKKFYAELLTTELFAITRQKADDNLQINTAYTDFAVALTHGVVGNPNPIALQICLNTMLTVLGDSLQQKHLEELDNLFNKYKLPLSRNAAITAQSDDNVVTNN